MDRCATESSDNVHAIILDNYGSATPSFSRRLSRPTRALLPPSSSNALMRWRLLRGARAIIVSELSTPH